MDRELKPCPFCGEADKHEDDCYIILLSTFYKEKGYFSVSETDLMTAWNTRAERRAKRVGIKYREVLCQIELKCGACGYPLYSDHDSYCSECGAKVVG